MHFHFEWLKIFSRKMVKTGITYWIWRYKMSIAWDTKLLKGLCYVIGCQNYIKAQCVSVTATDTFEKTLTALWAIKQEFRMNRCQCWDHVLAGCLVTLERTQICLDPPWSDSSSGAPVFRMWGESNSFLGLHCRFHGRIMESKRVLRSHLARALHFVGEIDRSDFWPSLLNYLLNLWPRSDVLSYWTSFQKYSLLKVKMKTLPSESLK